MPIKNINTRIKQKVDTIENWESSNPILLKGEIAIVASTNATQIKIGDGVSNFKSLPYISSNIYSPEINLTEEEIGKLMQMNVQSVRNLLSRSIQRARDFVSEYVFSLILLFQLFCS